MFSTLIDLSFSLHTVQQAFAPVHATRLLPIDPSNFTRGAFQKEVHLYSVGISCREERMRTAYDEIQEENDVDSLLHVYLSLVGCAVVLFTVFASVVSGLRWIDTL